MGAGGGPIPQSRHVGTVSQKGQTALEGTPCIYCNHNGYLSAMTYSFTD